MLKSILSVRTTCMICGWWGTVAEMEPDVDSDGNLGCPQCGTVIPVTVVSSPRRIWKLRLWNCIARILGVNNAKN